MSTQEIQEIGLDTFLTENYFTYGKYVNFNRAIPGTDGLKPVHRRVLMGLRKNADGKMISTVNAIGDIQALHPFGTISLETTIADMVRIGATTGEGSFGIKLIESIPAAAPRYTKMGLSNVQSDYNFKLVDYAPIHEGEVEMEPEYLITPIPYALIYGQLNWGLGILGRTPAFTYESLVEAYTSDDPKKLVPNFGYIMDESRSDLEGLWNNGVGKLTLKYSVTRLDADTILLVGSGEIFTPTLSMFNELVSTGQIAIKNESTNKVAIRIRRVSRSRVDMDEVYKMALQAAVKGRSYNILVVKDEMIQTISMKEWIGLTINRYKSAFSQYKIDRIAKCNLNIKTLEFLPAVARLLIDNKSDEQIFSAVDGLTEEIYSSIKRRSVSSLRRTEFGPEIESLNKQIKSIEKENVAEVILSYCK